MSIDEKTGGGVGEGRGGDAKIFIRSDENGQDYIRGTTQVRWFGDKAREARLRWFGHVLRRDGGYNQRGLWTYGWLV